jgi:putative acyl-CoA dehydrogenase
MASLHPRTSLPTHDVSNQPPPFEDVDLWTSDVALCEAVERSGGAWASEQLAGFGQRIGSSDLIAAGFEANRTKPELLTFDRYGQRIDEVRFHPSYHRLMAHAIEAGMPSVAWTAEQGGHVVHAAFEFMQAQIEGGVCCPLSMTYAVVPALRHQADLAAELLPKLLAREYDGRCVPIADKPGITMGMAMTEKQGGSDVRANTTRAFPIEGSDDEFELVGHKWFCSAPMSDAFLTLAQAPGGLTCFFVPRWRPDGTRNPFYIQRLKDKLGDHANASSEIEYAGTYARRVGELGRGVRTIIEMVHHTRLDCIVAPAAMMRHAVAQACWHTEHRAAFGKRLVEQPLMRQVLGDLIVESEAATALAMRIARSFDESHHDEHARAFSRLATPLAKFWLNKRVPELVYEAMECQGGAGYIEENIIARIYRAAPLNSIWEGSGNVICLDVLRALAREPDSLQALLDELGAAKGRDARYDRQLAALQADFTPAHVNEAGARRLCERLAVVLQASVLLREGDPRVATAFCAARLGEEGRCYGSLPLDVEVGPLLARARPQA